MPVARYDLLGPRAAAGEGRGEGRGEALPTSSHGAPINTASSGRNWHGRWYLQSEVGGAGALAAVAAAGEHWELHSEGAAGDHCG